MNKKEFCQQTDFELEMQLFPESSPCFLLWQALI